MGRGNDDHFAALRNGLSGICSTVRTGTVRYIEFTSEAGVSHVKYYMASYYAFIALLAGITIYYERSRRV